MPGVQKSPRQGGSQVVEIDEGTYVDTGTGEIIDDAFMLDDQVIPEEDGQYVPGDESQAIPDDLSQLSASEKRSRAARERD